MPQEMFYYNVKKSKFLQERKNNNYNTDKITMPLQNDIKGNDENEAAY